MADVAELHQEARKLPVRQHNELISMQFAIACHLPQHPCHQLCHRPPDDRPKRRRSLIGRFKPSIQQYLTEEPLSYKSAISSIHQDAVRTAIESSSSKLLNGRPTAIATGEQIRMEVASSRPDHLPTLFAAKSSVLSLLVKLPFWWRSGQCRLCYSVFCFSVPAMSKLTMLTVESLWTAPTETA